MPQWAQPWPQSVHHEPKGGGMWPQAGQKWPKGGVMGKVTGRLRQVSWWSGKSYVAILFL